MTSYLFPVRLRALVPILFSSILMTMMLAPTSDARPFLFGIQSTGEILDPVQANREAAIDGIKGTGADIARVPMSWKRVATNSSACSSASIADLKVHTHACYDWSLYDHVVAYADSHDLELLVSVYQVPEWVLGNEDHYYVGGSDAEFTKVAQRWAAFTRAAATRYNESSTIGTIHYWTIGNEPNSFFFWKPLNQKAPVRYAMLYSLAAPHVLAANPAAQVAPGPTGPKSTMKPQKWMRIAIPAMKRMKVKRNQISAWAHNPYPPSVKSPRLGHFRPPSYGMNNINQFLQELDRYPLTRRKPVWATEFGYQTDPPDSVFGVSFENQAIFLAECFDIVESYKRLRMAFWYVYKDNTIDKDWQSGLLDSDGVAKPAYEMFRRPISRSKTRIMRGESVRIWGASMLTRSGAGLYYSYNGSTWKRIPGQKNHRNDAYHANFMPTKNVRVRVQDSLGNGPQLRVKVA